MKREQMRSNKGIMKQETMEVFILPVFILKIALELETSL